MCFVPVAGRYCLTPNLDSVSVAASLLRIPISSSEQLLQILQLGSTSRTFAAALPPYDQFLKTGPEFQNVFVSRRRKNPRLILKNVMCLNIVLGGFNPGFQADTDIPVASPSSRFLNIRGGMFFFGRIRGMVLGEGGVVICSTSEETEVAKIQERQRIEQEAVIFLKLFCLLYPLCLWTVKAKSWRNSYWATWWVG